MGEIGVDVVLSVTIRDIHPIHLAFGAESLLKQRPAILLRLSCAEGQHSNRAFRWRQQVVQGNGGELSLELVRSQCIASRTRLCSKHRQQQVFPRQRV